MSLPELVLALALAGGAAVALGHVVTLVTHGVMSQEHRSQNQTEGALAMLRLRSELREADSPFRHSVRLSLCKRSMPG